MPINLDKYVFINSGVGGAAAANQRELIARLFTSSPKVPANTALEISTAADAGEFFGTQSAEFTAASNYFGFVNKYQRSPRKISFYRFAPEGSAPFIYATQAPATIAQLQAVTDGGMVINMGGVAYTLSDVNLSTAVDYASAAALLQTAIRANTAGGTLWTQATVTFNPADSAFVLSGGESGESVILTASAPETGTDLSALLKWNTASAPLLSQGSNAQSVTDTLNEAAELSNNFGSFSFLPALTNDQVVEAAQWTQAQNIRYMFVQRVTPDNYAALQPLVSTYDGVSLEYDAITDNSYNFIIPMAIMASTDYQRVNGTVAYMYTQFAGMPVSVDTTTLSNTLDSLRINYYGATQQAGQLVAFYQPGMLQGTVTDQGVFANEIWLKDAMTTTFLNQLIATSKWPANAAGVSIGTALAQDVIETAKRNGTISAGKELTAVQKAYITQITGNENAWREVYLNGCYFSAEIVQETQNGQNIFVFKYLLVYSKGDAVRKVDGTHTLI